MFREIYDLKKKKTPHYLWAPSRILFHCSNRWILCAKHFALYNIQFSTCTFSISASTLAISKQTMWPIVYLEIWKRYCRWCTSRLWPKIAMLLPTSFEPKQLLGMWFPFTIFGPTKLINNSKSAGASRVHFLCFPLNSWHFKSANQPVPLYTDLLLYKIWRPH